VLNVGVRTALLVVHIAAAAAWFGHKLLIPGDVARALGAGPQAASEMVVRVGRAAPLGIGSAVVTVLSGVALLAVNGWSSTVLRGIGIMAALGAVAVGAVGGRRAWGGVTASVADDDLATAAAFGRSFGRVLVSENVLWLVALAAMIAS
jgi:hypothetical protein